MLDAAEELHLLCSQANKILSSNLSVVILSKYCGQWSGNHTSLDFCCFLQDLPVQPFVWLYMFTRCGNSSLLRFEDDIPPYLSTSSFPGI